MPASTMTVICCYFLGQCLGLNKYKICTACLSPSVCIIINTYKGCIHMRVCEQPRRNIRCQIMRDDFTRNRKRR